jgi:hypothetical protein
MSTPGPNVFPGGAAVQNQSPYGVGYYQDTSINPGTASQMDTVNVTGGISGAGTGQFGSGTYDFSSFSDPAMQPIGVTQPASNVTGLPTTSGTTPTDPGMSGTSGGFDWGSVLSGLGNVLTSPLGSAAAMVGLGEYEAGQAQSQTAGLTGQLTGPAQPLVTGANQQLQQIQQGLTGAPVTGGAIGQQEQAAQNLGNIATQYSTGQLTTAQQQQVQQQVQSQQQQIRAQLASQGITDGSVLAMYDQQIQDNATQLTQSLINQNTTMAQQALQGVQQTYTGLISNALNEFGAGMGPIESAVNLTVQQNTQIANGLQQLFGQIARGFQGSSGGAGGTGTGTGGSSALGQIGNQLGKLFNSSGGATNIDTSALDSGVSSVASDLNTSTDLAEQGVASDVAQSNLDWLSSFNSAGGAAATTGAAAGAGGAASIGVDDVSMSSSVSDALNASSATGGASGGLGISAGQALGAAGAGLSLYNEINSWQSGATGTDALSGAETGAVVGTAIMPGIGTAIGAVGGALAGAVSSLFGGGKTDPENANFNQYTQAYNNAPANLKSQVAASVTNPYVALAGYFDLRSSQMKGQNPIYAKYGRMGEQAFTDDLIKKVDQAKASGQTDPTQIWTSTVQPWLASMGTWQDSNKDAMTALIQNMTGQIAAGTYKTNFKAVGGDDPFANVT